MSQGNVNLYEGLFLLSPAATSSDFNGAVEHVRQLFTRAGAELLVIRKWDERRLAYEIHGQKRGVYLLTYFKAQGSAIPHIERDVNLSEIVMRVMMLKADHIGEVELEVAARDADLSLEGKVRGGITAGDLPEESEEEPQGDASDAEATTAEEGAAEESKAAAGNG